MDHENVKMLKWENVKNQFKDFLEHQAENLSDLNVINSKINYPIKKKITGIKCSIFYDECASTTRC